MPVVFGPAGSQLFGLYHAPNPAVARRIGVVLCNPLGDEAMGAHRTYRHLAERLAAAGVPALRFDYHGTGDSSGDADEPARVEAWLESIRAAIHELQALAGTGSVDLFGLRFGATLATLAAAQCHDVRSLVLWAPSISGRAYVRELRAFRMIKERGAPSALGEADDEIAGYRFAPSTMAEMSTIDLLSDLGHVAERALVLPREGLPGGEEQLAKHLVARGVDVVVREAPGYATMMRDPQETVVPLATLDAIVEWLCEPCEPCEPAAATVGAAGMRSPGLTSWGQVTRQPVTEESLHFGDEGRLFGILTEPDAPRADRGRPALVFLNVGANHRVGPNRMYVALARDLAAIGYFCFRFDIEGLGDSLAADGRENELFSMRSVRDIGAAATLLNRIRGVRRVVVVGLCSGAYLGFHAAFTDPRVVGQILINPLTFEWKTGDPIEPSVRKDYKSTRYYLRALLDRKVWAQALRGGVDLRGVANVLRERAATRAGATFEALMARWRGRPVPSSPIERAFGAMSDRGVESLLVFSSTDGGLDMIEEHLGRGARKMRGRKNVRLEIVEGADHTFTSARSRRELYRLITGFLATGFPDAPPEFSPTLVPQCDGNVATAPNIASDHLQDRTRSSGMNGAS